MVAAVARRVTRWATTIMAWAGRHWLWVANLAVATILAGALLAPALMHWGHPGAGRALYAFYHLGCHQLPERSYFIFSQRPLYDYATLLKLAGGQDLPRRFYGNVQLGYKVAVCQRDVAIYAAWLLGGLAFGLVRRRVRPPGWRQFVWPMLPMAVDGTGQLLGLWQSTWWLRLITGALFGLALVWAAYPQIEQAMRQIAATAQELKASWRE